jgi:sulfatase maturation enzyme AslB (radical SAM superfamily)
MGASSDKSCRRNELILEQKLDVARQVKELSENGYDVRVDLSGGELFTDIPAHTKVLSAFSSLLGKDKVGVSCSGFKIDKKLAEFLSKTVHDVEMTMDVAPHIPYKLRPGGYSIAAANAAVLLKAAGCKVGLQTVASTYNSNYAAALAVFAWACANNVDNWSILRFFPSGRGAAYPEAAMNDAQCEAYVHMVQNMAAAVPVENKPKVDFHYLMPGHEKYTDVCRCVRHSIGILPNGDVVACFWALDSSTGAVDPKFLLGNVKDNTLLEILNGEKARYWSDCEHCCELSDNSGNDIERSYYYDVLSA